MKGDEGVELSKEVANLLLFDGAWHIQKHVFDLAKVNTFYGCSRITPEILRKLVEGLR